MRVCPYTALHIPTNVSGNAPLSQNWGRGWGWGLLSHIQ
jgi:hypothetical protein